jgi:predicted acylesterase/phospholipase RssA
MKPFRKHVAIAIDGGGIKGVIVTRALSILEDHLGLASHDVFRLAAGTSTGSVISAGIGVGLSGAGMYRLYAELGATVFRRTWRYYLWPLSRYRYSSRPLAVALKRYVGDLTMGDLWAADPPTDVVITVFDLVTNRTRFIKPWKEEYAGWLVSQAVLASSSVPSFFPVLNGRYVDGGVGSYANPCYLAAYEASICLGWDPKETTLISLGTGRNPHSINAGDADRFWAWDWIEPLLGAFLQSADDQQVHLVGQFFEELDFRRFQVDLAEPLAMDDPTEIELLTAYGDRLGRKILNDETDSAMEVAPRLASLDI